MQHLYKEIAWTSGLLSTPPGISTAGQALMQLQQQQRDLEASCRAPPKGGDDDIAQLRKQMADLASMIGGKGGKGGLNSGYRAGGGEIRFGPALPQGRC